MSGFAWVTLATNDSYCLGALVLAHSLKRVETKHDIAVLITPGVTVTMREKLSSVFNLVKEVNVLDSQDEANLALLARPELGVTFTKLHCWRLTQYEKCVFVDADTLVIRNCDELFDREELSAAPDVGWPDCFNSGVFVFKPSQQTFASLTTFAASRGSFDGGDQGLLNLFFSDWAHKDISKHLPFIYNMCSTASYSYLPAYKHFGGNVKIIHFIGNSKPWLQYFDTQTGQVHPTSELGHLQPLLQRWWDIFCENVHPQLSSAMLSYVDTNCREASSILAPREHNFFPSESSNPSLPNTSHHVCHRSTDKTYDEVDVVTNFSEFKDPWDNYIESTNCSGNDNHHSVDDGDDMNSANHNNDNHTFSPQNYQVQHCLIENSNHLNDIFDNFEYNNYNKKFDNFINNNLNFTSEDNFESQKNNQDNNKLIEHSSEHFFLTIEGSQLQDRECSEEYHKNNNYQESRINQLNCNNFRNEEEYSRGDESNDSNSLYPNDENDEINHNINDYCNTLPIKSLDQTQFEESSFKKLLEKNTENLKCVENVIKYNEIVLDIHSHSQSCTASQSIASQSEMSSADKIDCDCAGIAGALAKLTLGAARTPEQIIYEDHIRKQSWEQGQIDYMGRDSFDNIWKKICTTLSATPEENTQQKEKIPPKSEENKVPLKLLSDMNISATEDKLATEAELQDVIAESHTKQTDKKIYEGVASASSIIDNEKLKPTLDGQIQRAILFPILTSPISSEMNEKKAEPILALTSPPPQLCIKEFGEKLVEKPEETAESKKASKREKKDNKTTSMIPLSFPSRSKSNTPVKGEESNVADSPVPIQVAESVLEADIKESISEDVKPVREEAVSFTSTPVQESIFAIVETPLEPAAVVFQSVEAPLPQPNGSTLDIDSKSNEKNGTIRTSVSSEPTITVSASVVTEPRSLPILEQTSTAELKIKSEATRADDVPETFKTFLVHGIQSKVSSKADSGLTTAKVPELVPQESTKTTEESLKFQSEEMKPNVSLVPEKLESEHPASEISKETIEGIKPNVPAALEKTVSAHIKKQGEPVKSARSKELKIPVTPIVTEATPPTSPPLDVGTNLVEEPKTIKKITKKVTKKGSEDKPERSELEEGKKGAKKVVKKVVKKSKETLEEGESSSVGNKPKKIVKVAKKTTKSSGPTLEADTSIPDTPPPATSDAPVPPKRKVKSTAAKSSKKSESES